MPFARDAIETDNYLCVQLGDDGSQKVIIYDVSDSSVSENTGLSYGQYLESLQKKLLSSRLVYEEGLGLVSVA